ncbi:MAG: hypothetical protein FMNOHCHN_01347 [Ignavibacteriaceae bacterium]|nr:hypothetical protein [Ignavibacteriaceae bacterium]
MKKLFLSFMFFAVPLFAQNGTSAAEHLLLPVSASLYGMANADIAANEGINSFFYNPAGVHGDFATITGMFSYMRLIADMGLSYTSVAANFGNYGSMVFSVKSLEVGDIPETTVDMPYGTGNFFSPSLVVNSLGYSNTIGNNLSLGGSVNLIYEKIKAAEATGVSFDIGFLYKNVGSVPGLSVAGVVKNFGPAMQFDGSDLLITARDTVGTRGPRIVKISTNEDELPLITELGVTYKTVQFENYGVRVSGLYSGSSYTESEIRLGTEFSYNNQFFLRAGYAFLNSGSDEDRNIYGPAFGAGVHLNYLFDMKVDYAYRSARYFSSQSIITVQLGF